MADKRAERERLNPARWRGHLDTQLPARKKVAKPKHHAALPVSDGSTFMSALRKQEGSAARALEFTILTTMRSGEVRFATVARDRLRIAYLDRVRGEDDERPGAPSAAEPGSDRTA